MSKQDNDLSREGMRTWARSRFPDSLEELKLQLSTDRAYNFEEFVELRDPSIRSYCKHILDIGQTPNTLYANLFEQKHNNKASSYIIVFLHRKMDSETGESALVPISPAELDHPQFRETLQIAYRIVFAMDNNRRDARFLRSVVAYRFLEAGHIPVYPVGEHVKRKFFQEACETLWQWVFYETRDEDIADLTWQIQETTLERAEPLQEKTSMEVLQSEVDQLNAELGELKGKLREKEREVVQVQRELGQAKRDAAHNEAELYPVLAQSLDRDQELENVKEENEKAKLEIEHLKNLLKNIHELITPTLE